MKGTGKEEYLHRSSEGGFNLIPVSLVKTSIRRHGLFFILLITGMILQVLLSDRILPSDASDWFRNSVNLFESGKTGVQYRSILYSYFLAVPLFLGIEVTGFALLFSLLSIIVCTSIVYIIASSETGERIAALAAGVFILSFPILRYGTQVNSDIPALLFIMGSFFGVWLVLQKDKPEVIPLVYLLSSLSMAMRYGSAFCAPALLYFVWVTRRHHRLHSTGIILAVIPFIPQVVYNSHYLNHFYSITYSTQQPTMALRHFYQELNQGLHFQLLHYLKNIYFSFRGIPVYFLPMTITGIYISFSRLTTAFARFLVLFHVSFLILLSFFAGFENRYALSTLLPCFIWLALGAQRLFFLVNGSVIKRTLFLIWIATGLYFSFEIGFHIVQSSRSIHQARFEIFNKAIAVLNKGDIVCTELDNNFYDTRIKSLSLRQKDIVYCQSYDSLQTIQPSTPATAVYCIFPKSRWLSEGQFRKRDLRSVIPERFAEVTLLDSCSSEAIVELCFYRLLRLLNKEDMVPQEKWLLAKVSVLPCTTGLNNAQLSSRMNVIPNTFSSKRTVKANK